MIVRARRLLTPAGDLRPGWVRVDGPTVDVVGTGDPPAPPDRAVDLLVPGFVDAHCHGGGGASFADGPEQAALAAATHLRHGTTTVVASLVSAPVPVLDALVAATATPARLLGLADRGPWLPA